MKKRPTHALDARELAHQRRVRADLAEAAKAGQRVITGAISIDLLPELNSTPTRNTTMPTRPFRLAADPNSPTRYPLPPDPVKALAEILKALVLPPDASADDVRAAVEALLDAKAADPTTPENIEAASRRLGLSDRETKMLVQGRVDPAKYAELRQRMTRRK